MKTLILSLLCVVQVMAAETGDLWLRGYSVIPTPRKVELEGGDVVISPDWTVTGETSGIAFRSLTTDAEQFHHLSLRSGNNATKVIHLAVKPGTVTTGAGAGIDRQAYQLRISDNAVEITGNADTGLFYGVQTFIQLLKRDTAGRLVVPRCAIEDWPKLELRFLHWDTKHHQDRMETLKRYLDWTARFKANMIAFELEDKFAYPSHPVIGAPGAFTPAQLQEIVDYGLERHIQVVPDVQAPAHLAYVLKHPEFAELRADGMNYQAAFCDPRTDELIFSMYDDLIRATKGIDYFYVSTDEMYYAGTDKRCAEPYNDVTRSRHWAEFVRRANEHLAKFNRRPLAWVEYPLLPRHIKLLPPNLIDGVVGEEEYLKPENELGIRQMAYVSMQGSELLFPNSLSLESNSGVTTGRLESARRNILTGRYRRGNPIGAFGAAWDDSGLHDETFWLGWSGVARWAWNPDSAPVEQHVAEFIRTYYGPRVTGMAEAYRSMQRQARAWQSTWKRVQSRTRSSGYGNSSGKGIGVTRWDYVLDPPPLPQLPELAYQPRFADRYRKFLATARDRAIESDRLLMTLSDNLGRADRNRYNIEVYLALARFMRHHWQLLAGLASAERSLSQARGRNPATSVGRLVAAYNTVAQLHREGETVFSNLRRVYEKSRYPKGRSVNGREFFHKLDDVKDHWADRTADLSFMMGPERSLKLDQWLAQLADLTHAYAKRHNVPVKGLAEARLEE